MHGGEGGRKREGGRLKERDRDNRTMGGGRGRGVEFAIEEESENARNDHEQTE